MSREEWNAVDQYLDLLVQPDAALNEALAASNAAGLPPINVSPTQGKLLHVLALIRGARSVLEVGTLGGYSAIWLARALPADGRVVTLEIDPKHAEVARRNFERAGVAGRIDIRLGPALDTLPQLAAEGRGPFDFFFIDADKPSNSDYFEWALKLSRPGSVIVVDNVVRQGRVIDAQSTDAHVMGARRLFEAMSREKRITSTVIQTVGLKGYDGFAIAIVL